MRYLDLLSEIKKSKKYKDISDEIVLMEIKKGGDIKEIKSRLHNLASSFRTTKKKKAWKLLEELKIIKTEEEMEELIKELLSTNRSTKERVDNYTEIYKKIFKITGKQESIVDLGSGLNGVSYSYFGYNPEYFGYDIDVEEARIVNEFFKIMKINGKQEVLDCSKIENISQIKADIIFMFNFIDIIDKAYGKGHKLAEDIIKKLNCDWIVVSFATKTLSGKHMKYSHRGWIEKMLERIEYNFEMIKLSNEVFYVIHKI